MFSFNKSHLAYRIIDSIIFAYILKPRFACNWIAFRFVPYLLVLFLLQTIKKIFFITRIRVVNVILKCVSEHESSTKIF